MAPYCCTCGGGGAPSGRKEGAKDTGGGSIGGRTTGGAGTGLGLGLEIVGLEAGGL